MAAELQALMVTVPLEGVITRNSATGVELDMRAVKKLLENTSV
jgi:hypothetical protein